MKNKKSLKRVLLAGFVILVSGLFLLGSCTKIRWMRASTGERIEMIVSRFTEGYQLDENQQALFNTTFNNIYAEFSMTKEEKEEGRQNLKKLILSDTLDTAAIIEKYKRGEAERLAKYQYVLEQAAVLHASLTPEQKEKLAGDVDSIFAKLDEYSNK